ncbi:hypothetical protein ACW95P_02820 [Candidatus Mycoplasma pogonae]
MNLKNKLIFKSIPITIFSTGFFLFSCAPIQKIDKGEDDPQIPKPFPIHDPKQLDKKENQNNKNKLNPKLENKPKEKPKTDFSEKNKGNDSNPKKDSNNNSGDKKEIELAVPKKGKGKNANLNPKLKNEPEEKLKKEEDKTNSSLAQGFSAINNINQNVIEFKANSTIYRGVENLRNSNLGFVNNKLLVQKTENNKYLKNWRINQLMDKEVWSYQKATKKFIWSIDQNLFNDVLDTEPNYENTKLLVYLAIHPKKTNLLENNHYNLGWYYKNNVKGNVFNSDSKKNNFPLGIGLKIDYQYLLTNGNYSVDLNLENVRLTITKVGKKLNFEVENIDKTNNLLFHNYSLFNKDKNQYLFDYLSSFTGIQYQTTNPNNNSLIPYKLNSKYDDFVSNAPDSFPNFSNDLSFYNPELDQVSLFDSVDLNSQLPKNFYLNAFDTEYLQRVSYKDFIHQRNNVFKYQNSFVDFVERIYKFNENKIMADLRSRTFSASGTWTMISKVNVDRNDGLYYVATNKHVFDKYSGHNFKINPNFNDDKPIGDILDTKGYIPFGDMVAKWTNDYGKKLKAISPLNLASFVWYPKNVVSKQNNPLGYDHTGKHQLDMGIAIIDINLILKTISNPKHHQIMQQYFKKWENLPPLSFNSPLKHLIYLNSGTNLVDIYINGYPGKANLSYHINKIINTGWLMGDQKSEPVSVGINSNNYKKTDKFNNWYLNTKGSSGTAFVDGQNNIAGVYWGGIDISTVDLFKSWWHNVIGDNTDDDEGQENVSPGSFCSWVRQLHEAYPDKISLLPICT